MLVGLSYSRCAALDMQKNTRVPTYLSAADEGRGKRWHLRNLTSDLERCAIGFEKHTEQPEVGE